MKLSELTKKTVEELETYFKDYNYWGEFEGRERRVFGLSSGYILKTIENIEVISCSAFSGPEGEIKIIKKPGIICIGKRRLVIYCGDIKIIVIFHSRGDLWRVSKVKWR